MPTNSDSSQFLRSRRSIRRFSSRPVESEKITRILETARYAPSAHNSQPWRFAVISTAETKKQLAEKMGELFKLDLLQDGVSDQETKIRVERSKNRILNVPIVIILCLDNKELNQYNDKKRQELEIVMGIQSVAMAGLQLLLAAHGEGLGGVWTCGPLFVPEIVRSTLSLPETWKPQGMVHIGYPDEQPKIKELKRLGETVFFIE